MYTRLFAKLLIISIVFSKVDISTTINSFTSTNHITDSTSTRSPIITNITNNNKLKIKDIDNPTVQPTYYQSHHTQITTIAGDRTASNNTDDWSPAALTSFNKPRGIWGDSAGNIFISEEVGNKV